MSYFVFIPYPSLPPCQKGSAQFSNPYYPQFQYVNFGVDGPFQNGMDLQYPIMMKEEPQELPEAEQVIDSEQNEDQQDQNIKPRQEKHGKNKIKEIASAKKNSEANLLNHFLSFYTNQSRSKKMLESCIRSIEGRSSDQNQLIDSFYQITNAINIRRNRKYINRNYFRDLFRPRRLLKRFPELGQLISQTQGVSLRQICLLLRKCCFHFFRTLSIDYVMVSRRLSNLVKPEHLKRRRKILQGLE